MLLFAVPFLTLPVLAQQKPTAETKPPETQAVKPADPPVLSDKQAKELAIVERNLVQDQSQMQSLQQQYSALQEKQKQDSEEYQKKLDAAKVPGWTLNPIDFTYTKNPPEPEKPASAESKKPEADKKPGT